MLAAALGTLAAAHAATWGRSQADQATYQAAADVRVVAADYSKLPTWAAGPLYRSIPGVRQASAVTVAPFDLGRTIRDGRLVGLDPTTVGNVLSPQAATSGSPAAANLLATLTDARPTVATLPLEGDPQRLAVTVDPALEAEDLFADQPTRAVLGPKSGTLSVTAILADADGRLFRTATASGNLTTARQRLIVPIVDASTGVAVGSLRPTAPLRLDAIELVIEVTDQVSVFGSVDLVSVEASSVAAGGAGWVAVPVDPQAPGWQWRQIDQQKDVIYTPTPERPGRVSIGHDRAIPGGEAGFGTTTFRLGAGLPEDVALPAIASTSFLAQTGNAVGDSLLISSLGVPVRIRILAATDLFAPLDPAVPFVVTDLAAYDAIQLAATGQTRQADEWWLSVDPGQAAAVLDRLRQPAASARSVIGRDELARDLSTDPVPLGLIGILGLGSVAAMLFAGIGFLVSSTVSTSQRLAEFALLRALGLSTGQLALWLSIESIFLLVVGLVAGSLLGLVLAWLVLPFATLTQTGAVPIPAPVVVIPWEAIVPVYLAAVLLFIVSIWLVRRQLPDVRISGVLRAGQG
jgi:hypothetical protein